MAWKLTIRSTTLVFGFLLIFYACQKEKIALSPQEPPLHATVGTTPGIYDAEGRFVLLRGVNYNVLGDYWQANPSIPTTKDYAAADIEAIASYGFNCIRLLFSWSALETEPGVYDQTYIEEIKTVIEEAAKYDLYILLDMHQDAWGKHIATPEDTVCTHPNKGWDGAPLWATFTDGMTTCSPNGAREKAPAVIHSWQNFWDNKEGIQDNCIGAWAELVHQTAAYPNVVGYDLINEPSLGYKSVQEEIVKMGNYYDNLIKAIRSAESIAPSQQKIIFFENSIQWNGQDAVSLPNYGFTDDQNIVFAPHSYFEAIQFNYTIEDGFEILRFGSTIFGTALFIGEWGFFGDPNVDSSKVKRFAAVEDQYFSSSTWWQWAQAPGDPHGISWDGNSYSATSLHLVELDEQAQLTGNINQLYLDILSRTRPNAIAGQPTSLISDPDSGEMTLEATGTGVTELWVPDRFGEPIISGTGSSLKKISEVAGGYIVEVNVQGNYTINVQF